MKQTPDLVALCHPIAVHGVCLEVAGAGHADEVLIRATVRTADGTRVEMSRHRGGGAADASGPHLDPRWLAGSRTVPRPGGFVAHVMSDGEKGAHGLLHVSGAG